jgi:hypothetical protein
MDPITTDSSVLADTDTDTDTDTTGTTTELVPTELALPVEAIDLTDPAFTAVALLAAVLVTAVSRKVSKARPALAALLAAITPPFAVLAAVLFRGVADVVWGVPLSFSVVGQGLTVGAYAVTSHASWRSIVKHVPSFLALLFTKAPASSE